MARGLAQVQEGKAVWRRLHLIWCLGEQLPDHAGAPNGAKAAAQLEAMAASVLAGRDGPDEHPVLERLYLRILGRPPRLDEIEPSLASFEAAVSTPVTA